MKIEMIAVTKITSIKKNHFAFLGQGGIIEVPPFRVLWKEENNSRYHFDERHLEKASAYDPRIRPYNSEFWAGVNDHTNDMKKVFMTLIEEGRFASMLHFIYGTDEAEGL